MNPHAIPSRMTGGHLIESIVSIAAAVKGNLTSQIPFEMGMEIGENGENTFKTVEDIADDLKKLGYDGYGSTVLYNPHTGRKMKALIFIGAVFYQRLKHMVRDKAHSRRTGKNEILTRQPVEVRRFI